MIICQFLPPLLTKKNLPAMTLIAHNSKLIMLDWQTHKQQKIIDHNKSNLIKKSQEQMTQNNPDEAIILKTIVQIDEYLEGKRQNFDIELDLSSGTLFQQKVWQQILQIPYGETISYAQLASTIEQPTAFRAVANANGKNPLSLLVPCHRVVASGGGLGGYTGGLQIKQALLDIERATIGKLTTNNMNSEKNA